MALAKQKPAPAPEKPPKLDDFLCFAIYSTNLAVNRVYKPLLDELGLTYPQYIVLIALYDEDDQTVGGLGDKLFLDSSTLTPLLKRMEAMGHLTRQRDPEDERQVRVRLTPQGRSVREKGIMSRSSLLNSTNFSPAEYEQLREQMVKLRAYLSDAWARSHKRRAWTARFAHPTVLRSQYVSQLADFRLAAGPQVVPCIDVDIQLHLSVYQDTQQSRID